MAFVGYLLGALSVIAGLAVITLRNPVMSALALVANLLLVAGMFATMEAHFIAAAQVVVYAGAIMVLVLFVLMLLNVKQEADKTGIPLMVLAVAAGAIFLTTVIPIILTDIGNISEVSRADGALNSVGDVASIGKVLFGTYAVPFEITSALIMVGIVGAIMIAKKRKTT